MARTWLVVVVSAAGGEKWLCVVGGWEGERSGEKRQTKESAMIVLRPAAMAGRGGGRQPKK